MVSWPKPHYEYSPLRAPQIPYQKLLRTETLMEMSIGKTELYKSSMYYYTVFNITYFFYHCVHCYILCLKKKTEETNHFQYKYKFYEEDHVCWISNFYHNYTTRKLNFWSWKQHIWQWKDKEDRSRNEVLYVILILNDSRNNMKWSTIISRVIIFLYNPTAPWCDCLILARFLRTFVMAEIGSWIILVVDLVTLQVLCHWTKNNSPMGKVSTKCRI